jgi:hypothetical protein
MTADHWKLHQNEESKCEQDSRHDRLGSLTRKRIIHRVMPKLADLHGQEIAIRLVRPLVGQKQPMLFTRLVEIEPSGIWIEGTDFAEYAQAKLKKPLAKTPVFFVPFAQIAWIASYADYPYLSEQSLGLKNP